MLCRLLHHVEICCEPFATAAKTNTITVQFDYTYLTTATCCCCVSFLTGALGICRVEANLPPPILAMASDGEFDRDPDEEDEQQREHELAVEAARLEFEQMEALESEPFADSGCASSSTDAAPPAIVTSLSPSTVVESTPERPKEEIATSLSPSTSVQTPPAEPPRKRLRGKTSVAQAEPPVLPIQKTSGVWEQWDPSKYLTPKAQYKAIWYKLGWWLKQEQTVTLMVPKVLTQELLQRAKEGLRFLLGSEKTEVVQAFLDNTEAPQEVREIARAFGAAKSRLKEESRHLVCKNVLLTYNGPWGKMPDDYVKSGTNEAGLVEQLKRDGRLNTLWAAFRGFVDALMKDVSVTSWAASMELCTTTYEKGEGVRVHLHLALKSEVRKLDVTPTRLAFRDGKPFVRLSVPGLSNRGAGGWSHIYYCLCPKRGVIYQAGNCVPFSDFPVRGDWPFTLLQAGKMNQSDCREEIIRAGRGIVRLLTDFERYTQALEELRIEKRMNEYAVELAKTQLKCVTLQQVEEWKKAATQPFQRRKKFLVLEGPSGLGKTEFIKDLFGAEKVLELNCGSCGDVVNLRQFKPGQHVCVLFDEASAHLVLNNRKVFQAPPGWIELGHSPTGRDVYKVFLGDTVLALNSNKWTEELERIAGKSPSDHAWLVKNAVRVEVTANMFIP